MLIGLELAGAFGGDGWTLETLVDVVVKAEKRGVAFVALPDEIADVHGNGGWPDATILLGWLAAKTERIGLVAATGTGGHQPYNLSRRIASLDMIAKGRIGWWVRTDQGEAEQAAFSGAMRMPGGNTPERVAEFVEVVEGLWHGWDADALLLDKEGGRFLDPAKMHYLDHSGAHFSVRGPLNIMRSPQDRPVVVSSAKDGVLVSDLADVVVGDGDAAAGRKRFKRVDAAADLAAMRSGPDGVVVTVNDPAEAERFLASLEAVSSVAPTLREVLMGVSR